MYCAAFRKATDIVTDAAAIQIWLVAQNVPERQMSHGGEPNGRDDIRHAMSTAGVRSILMTETPATIGNNRKAAARRDFFLLLE